MQQPVLPQTSRSQDSENLGSLWLDAMRHGDFESAWQVSDRVLASRDPARRDDPALPYYARWVWDGREFAGREVLVRCYHGLGDTLMFCRYLAPLRRGVRRLTLEAQPELVPLLRSVPGPDSIVPFRPAAPLPASACDLEIMELAHALRMRPEPAPYLSVPDPARSAPRTGLQAGLCWGVTTDWQPERSVPPSLLRQLDVPGVTFWSLQRGPEPECPLPLANPEGCAGSMLDTARLVLGMDLVITVDTMIAHLAGGLGVPVWLLLLAEPDWRWLAGGRGSPWYPAIRKYRQPRPGDWPGVLAETRADLTRAAGGHSVRELGDSAGVCRPTWESGGFASSSSG